MGLLFGLVVPSVAQAAPPRSVDPHAFDVAGVKTGMGYEEVVAALAAHFQVPAAAIKPDPAPGANIVTGTRLPSYVSFETGGTRVSVQFEGRVPPDPARPLVAWMVSYEVPWTPGNAGEMAKAAVAKYGTPSNAPNTLPMQWCARPSSNPGIGCKLDEARLDLSQVSMKLIDPAWQAARISFVQERGAVRPKF